MFFYANMKRVIVAIGGGEIKDKSTLPIDREIAAMVYASAEGRRPNALFVGTASHDYMPYFNSFRKTYTSELGMKADVAMTVFKKTEYARLEEKFALADLVYVGGGDTLFMLESWKESGILPLVKDAYERGVIIAGLSAGAICWFEEIYTDSRMAGREGYSLCRGMGWLKGTACPHYNLRRGDFLSAVKGTGVKALAVEDNCAVVFENERPVRVLSSGGRAFYVEDKGKLTEEKEITCFASET